MSRLAVDADSRTPRLCWPRARLLTRIPCSSSSLQRHHPVSDVGPPARPPLWYARRRLEVTPGGARASSSPRPVRRSGLNGDVYCHFNLRIHGMLLGLQWSSLPFVIEHRTSCILCSSWSMPYKRSTKCTDGSIQTRCTTTVLTGAAVKAAVSIC